MAIQGKAAKSASGASMSKYDVEVEGRLQKLENSLKTAAAELTWLKGKMEELTATGKTGPAADGVEELAVLQHAGAHGGPRAGDVQRAHQPVDEGADG